MEKNGYFQVKERKGARSAGYFMGHYFFLSYMVILGIMATYLDNVDFINLRTTLFILAVFFSYGFIYLVPSVVLTVLVQTFLKLTGRKSTGSSRLQVFPTVGVALLATGLTMMVLLADSMLYELYGFHINGFVWNLVITPGGIESLGGSKAAFLYFTVIVIAFLVLQIFLLRIGMAVSRKIGKRQKERPVRIVFRFLIVLLVVLSIGERATYGISKIQAYSPILVSARTFPFYLPASFSSLTEKLGYHVERHSSLKMPSNGRGLDFPKNSLQTEKPSKTYNIVWLVAESWRWDILHPEIMPATWDFAARAYRFTRHYSGGNGTRQGLFSMFYGLYGNYWFDFLDERRAPVFMDRILEQDYQVGLYTSARFSYPEFDKTLFVNVPAENMHEYSTGEGWERDRKNVADLLQFLENRDTNLPFMAFMFFESPHARYYFPPENVIKPDYLEDFNYATMSLERDIERIKNRYINACNHLDSQFERILDRLNREKLLENTIVIITGDHGEEFMEKGRWGHNSHFSEEQLRVPLVLWVPGQGKGVMDRMTSHVDIVPTLMPLLGVTNPPGDYCLGYPLFGDKQREHAVAAGWSEFCYMNRDHKVTVSFDSKLFGLDTVTDRNDRVIKNEQTFFKEHQRELLSVLQDMGAFRAKE